MEMMAKMYFKLTGMNDKIDILGETKGKLQDRLF